MNPNTVFSASLVTSLVLWYPSLQACLRGDLDLTPAGLRYLAALAVSRVAMNFLARLINGYSAVQHLDGPPPAEAPRVDSDSPAADAPAAGAPQQRRRSDRHPADEADPASLPA